MNSVLPRRTFFSTEAGYIGIGPHDAKPGDLVCVFYGGRPCYVVRENPDISHQTFLGDAYLHGLMDGRVLDMRDQKILKERRFMLQ
jgi:hypothetical protein